jgi:glycosyltransferase involved in cell wall biosynthesis
LFFSIITVTKNSEKKIEATIKSVLTQTYKNFEYIILDGFSEDQTFNKIKQFKKKNIFLYRYKDKNFYDGLNYAISKSKGNYIGILNSGDIYYNKNILKKMKKFITNYNSYDYFYSNLLYFNKDFTITRVWNNNLENKILHKAFQIPHPTMFVSRKIIKSIKYDIDYKISSDLDFILQIIKKKFTGKYLNFFSIYMENSGMSTSLTNAILKLKEDLNIHRTYFKNYLFSFFLNKLLKTRSYFFKKKYKFKKNE